MSVCARQRRDVICPVLINLIRDRPDYRSSDVHLIQRHRPVLTHRVIFHQTAPVSGQTGCRRRQPHTPTVKHGLIVLNSAIADQAHDERVMINRPGRTGNDTADPPGGSPAKAGVSARLKRI